MNVQQGEVVYVVAWWRNEAQVRCEVMGFDEDWVVVREHNGDPNRRWVDRKRIIRKAG